MPMKWNDCSFLLELKPHSEFANLFVSCPDGASRELIKILRNSIDICGGGNSNVNHLALSSGTIKGVNMCPESISNLAWADNETLFTCRLKADSTDRTLNLKSCGQLSREVKGSINLDDFTKRIRSVGPSIVCSYCEESLLPPPIHRNFKTYALPCDDWEESISNLDFFCHDSNHQSTNISNSQFTNKDMAAEREINEECLVADSFFLLHESLIKSRICVQDNGLIQCNHCLSELGKIQQKKNPGGYMGDEALNGQSVEKEKGKKRRVKLFHSTVDLMPADVESICKDQTFLLQRFGCMEKYFAWWLLTQSHRHSSLKFVIRSLDSTPKLLLWLLDSYSLMVRGKLAVNTPLRNIQDSEGERNGNQKSEDEVDGEWVPFPALKVLFKVFDDGNSADPRVSGEDFSVVNLEQPSGACLAFTQLLLDSSQSLPPACRSVGQFYVGYLRLSDCWNTEDSIMEEMK